MNDKEFNELADAMIGRIEAALEASAADIDFELAAGGVLAADWRAHAASIDRAFVARRLSPGGSADLLGITLFSEHVSISYWIGLVGVWIGSAIYLTMTIRDHEVPAVEEPC